MDVQTTRVKIVITIGPNCGSASWINIYAGLKLAKIFCHCQLVLSRHFSNGLSYLLLQPSVGCGMYLKSHLNIFLPFLAESFLFFFIKLEDFITR